MGEAMEVSAFLPEVQIKGITETRWDSSGLWSAPNSLVLALFLILALALLQVL